MAASNAPSRRAPAASSADNVAAVVLVVVGAGGFFLVSALLVFGFYLLVTRHSRASAKAKAAAALAVQAAQAPDIAAWNALGSTADEREKTIKLMFHNQEGSLSVGTRSYFRGKGRGDQGNWTYDDNCFVELRISRSLAAMEPREREFLRTVYLLFNAGEINEQQFRYYGFAFINGDGKATIDRWTYWFPGEEYVAEAGIKNGPDVVRFHQNQRDASVDSAVNALMGVLQKLGRKATAPRWSRKSTGACAEAARWFGPEDLPGTMFEGDGPYAVRLGVLDGSDEVLCYAGEGSLITIAPPGSGKTQCFVLPNMLTWPGPAVVLDVKGEIYAATSAWRAKNVGPVFRFSPLDPANSHCYNPLVFVRADPEYLWEDSRFLADMMLVPSGAADPFWESWPATC